MEERRKEPRLRAFLGGVIAFNQRKSTMDCVIRNMSPAGVRVVLDNTATLPDKFDLTIESKQRSFRARMVWRDKDVAGLAFINANHFGEPIQLDWARRLRDCEAEKAALRRRIDDLSTAR
jgi:PilZ domain